MSPYHHQQTLQNLVDPMNNDVTVLQGEINTCLSLVHMIVHCSLIGQYVRRLPEVQEAHPNLPGGLRRGLPQPSDQLHL